MRRTGAFEWPLRVLLIIGGFFIATPGGGVLPVAQWQMTSIALAILVPTVAVATLLARQRPPQSALEAYSVSAAARYAGKTGARLDSPAAIFSGRSIERLKLETALPAASTRLNCTA